MEETNNNEKETKQKITKETTIGEVLQISPKAAEILMNEGLHCIGCCGAAHESINDGLKMHGKSEEEIEEVVKKLNESLSEESDSEETGCGHHSCGCC